MKKNHKTEFSTVVFITFEKNFNNLKKFNLSEVKSLKNMKVCTAIQHEKLHRLAELNKN